jgi:DNA-binding FadR family transcriptional regulator
MAPAPSSPSGRTSAVRTPGSRCCNASPECRLICWSSARCWRSAAQSWPQRAPNRADLERLARCHDEVSAAYASADRARQVRADVAFHRAIAQATCNPVFAHLVGSLLELLHEHVLISIAGWLPESTDMRRLRHQHAQLFERIVAQDVRGAAATARGHIAFVRRSWQQRLAKEVGPAKARPFDAPLSP